MPGRHGRRVVVLFVGALMLAAVPSARSAVQKPVAGIHQAYHGVLTHPPVSSLSFKRFFFTGEAADQVNKLAGSPSATFSTTKPTGSTITQNAFPEADDVDGVPYNDELTAYFTGAYTGSVDGYALLNQFWSSNNIAQGIISPSVEVSFWADPKSDGTAKLIGRVTTTATTAVTPQFTQTFVRVKGTVANTLVVQLRTIDDAYSEDLRLSYGSADAPSGFGMPIGKPATFSNATANVATPYKGPALELQSADIGSDAGEPTIGVQKDGTAFMFGGGFLDTTTGSGLKPDIRRSTDGGVTWRSVQKRLPNGDTDPPGNLDPMLYIDTTTGRVFDVELYAACSQLNYSDDNGKNWTTNPLACGVPVNDHETLVTGKPPPGVTTSGYPNVVYYCSAFDLYSTCGRSLDGGDTFLPLPGLPFPLTDPLGGPGCGGPHGHIIADTDGRLFIPTGRCGYPAIAISEDGGNSWMRVKVSDMSAHDIQTSVAADTAGNLYYGWDGGPNKLPYLSVSTDHGRTWSPPRLIAPPGVLESNWPTIDAGTPGRIAITFPGTTAEGEAPAAIADEPAAFGYAERVVPEQAEELLAGGERGRERGRDAAAADNPELRPWNLYVVVSTNGLSDDPLFVSSTANVPSDPVHRGACGDVNLGRCGLMFDFLDVVVAPSGQLWATLVDTCVTDACIHPAADATDPNGLSMRGVAIRQIGGPTLREVKKAVAPKPTTKPAVAPKQEPNLPVTGASVTLIALALVWAAFLLRIRFGMSPTPTSMSDDPPPPGG